MRYYSCQLSIADIVIRLKSKFPLEKISQEEKQSLKTERYYSFTYRGKAQPEIIIEVKIADRLPVFSKGKNLFITRHFSDNVENWRLLERRDGYLYKSPLKAKEQLITVNKKFNRATAYLLPKPEKGKVWASHEIIYDFLQVLLINYLAQKKMGMIAHAVGIKELDASGLLFAGKSGAGKSTTARLWHKHSQAMVLNDDRMIIRKKNRHFFIYGSPWHGDFSDYLAAKVTSAKLKKIFFIRHSLNNKLKRISEKEAFLLLYPALFPPFWDKRYLEFVAHFSCDLFKSIPAYRLGFLNSKEIISFVRSQH